MCCAIGTAGTVIGSIPANRSSSDPRSVSGTTAKGSEEGLGCLPIVFVHLLGGAEDECWHFARLVRIGALDDIDRRLPATVRDAILSLKAEHPPLHTYEITTICWVRFGHRPSSHTVKRILAENPPAPTAARRYPPYQRIADAAEARLAIARLHSEGWNKKSIAAYLHAAQRAPDRTRSTRH
jgi:hypothetical protein